METFKTLQELFRLEPALAPELKAADNVEEQLQYLQERSQAHGLDLDPEVLAQLLKNYRAQTKTAELSDTELADVSGGMQIEALPDSQTVSAMQESIALLDTYMNQSR